MKNGNDDDDDDDDIFKVENNIEFNWDGWTNEQNRGKKTRTFIFHANYNKEANCVCVCGLNLEFWPFSDPSLSSSSSAI